MDTEAPSAIGLKGTAAPGRAPPERRAGAGAGCPGCAHLRVKRRAGRVLRGSRPRCAPRGTVEVLGPPSGLRPSAPRRPLTRYVSSGCRRAPCQITRAQPIALRSSPFRDDRPQCAFSDFPVIWNGDSTVGRRPVAQDHMAARLVIKVVPEENNMPSSDPPLAPAAHASPASAPFSKPPGR